MQRDRRLHRLREELHDEMVPLDVDGPDGAALLEEIDYARRPPMHEGMSPRFGAIVGEPAGLDPERLGYPALVEPTELPLDIVRRLADGRTSFVGRDGDRVALVSFDRTIEHEATAVDVSSNADVTVVQRLPTGWVRVFAPHAVVTWDGARWWSKPRARHLASAIQALHPELDSSVLAGLCEFSVHWLSAGRVGALLVWHLRDEVPEHLGFNAATAIPPLDVSCRQHFSALLSVLAQTDRAALVTPDGHIEQIGVALRWAPDSVPEVPAYRGTRHTSALRFSHGAPDSVVFVVSSAGPVTVVRAGTIIAAASTTTMPSAD